MLEMHQGPAKAGPCLVEQVSTGTRDVNIVPYVAPIALDVMKGSLYY